MIVLYLSIAFEWRMASAALVALVHDIVITVGVYALLRFQVSPATVIGLLTILGYSLYDTVVVFDKVRENTAGLLATRRTTYSEAANLALNQTLVRSINTSLIALLPVVSILAVSVFLLGNGELKDLSLVLFVGMLSGTYSSICIATPVLADLKEREPDFKQLRKQIAQRAGSTKRQAKVAVGSATGAGEVVQDGADDAGRRRREDVDAQTAPVTAARPAGGSARPGRRPGRGSSRGGRAPRSGARQARRSAGRLAVSATEAGADGRLAGGGARDIAAVLRRLIRDVPDYPQPGVVFKDITPLLADAAGFAAAVDALAAGHDGSTRWPGSRPGVSSSPLRSPASSASASCRCASSASCPGRRTPRRTSSSTAPRRSRSTWTRSRRATGC